MQPTQWKIAASLVAGLGLAVRVVAAEAPKETVKLSIKPGLWEIASQGEMSGAPPMPEDMLARMTPEQRARYEAAMQGVMANAAKPRLGKSCVTPEQIERGLSTEHTGSQNCQKKITTNSSSELAISEQCAEQDGTVAIDEHFKLSGSEEVNGTIHLTGTRGGKSFTANHTIHGKWLGASCGDVKNYEPEK